MSQQPICNQPGSQHCHNDRRAGENSREGALVVEWLHDLARAAERVLYQRGLAPNQLLTHRTQPV